MCKCKNHNYDDTQAISLTQALPSTQRKRKQRCSGDRPACTFCAEKQQTCSYEVADGMTRTEDLKHKVQEATEKGDKLVQLVCATGHTRAIFNTPSQASRRCFHRRPFACGNRPESVPRVYQEWASRGTFSFRKPDRYAMTQIAFWILEISANQHSCVRANYEPSRRRDLSFDNRFPNVFFRFLYATARTVACRYGSSE
jgi:hypothetical protein